MRFGIFDHLDLASNSSAQQFEDRLALMGLYDRHGFHAYHLAEHHGTTLGIASSPSVFLAAASQRTKKLRFGPLNYIVSMYHPLRLLEEVCMLDHLSQGRFELGVGRGVSPFELAYYGVNPAETPAIFQEVLSILRAGFATDSLTHEGKYFRFKDVPMVLKPFQQPHPPIWYGISNPESSPWAAQNALNVVSISRASIVRKITDAYRAAWAEAGGKNEALPFVGLSRHVVVGETDAKALEVARRAYRVWQKSFTLLYRMNNTAPKVLPFPEEFDDAQEMGFTFAGSPATVRKHLADQTSEAGVNYFAAQLVFGDMSFAEAQASIELFAREVMPSFQEK